jgi:hypothetical protein
MGWSNFPENWETDAPHIEVLDIDKVPTELTVGTKYHCTWASKPGMVWVLKGISQNNQAILETPRSKKIIYTHVHNLRHINKNALLQAKVRIKKENRLKELKDKELDTLT